MTVKRKRNSNSTIIFLFIIIILSIGIFSITKMKVADDEENLDQEQIVENNREIDQDELVEDDQKEDSVAIITTGEVNYNDFITSEGNTQIKYTERQPIKGVFLTGYTAGISSRLDNLIQIANETEVNAFVIDVKDDSGRLTFNMDIPLADEIGAENSAIKDIDEVMNKLYDNNIYPIARIVAFKDPYLSKNVQDYAIKNQDGSLFYYGGISWLNPYNEDSWAYIVDVAKEAIKVGFKEIQFDYIRFEATYRLKDADFGHTDTAKTREEIILDFLDYVNAELADYDVVLSADVFGTIITSKVDAEMIGQNYIEMAKRLDVICPMVYPSHYGRGYYGIPYEESPDLHPYEIIYGSMSDSNEKLSTIREDEKKAVVRPWLQAFTASYLGQGNYMTYGPTAIRDQIQAAYDAGLTEWLLWNAGNTYNSNALLKEEISN